MTSQKNHASRLIKLGIENREIYGLTGLSLEEIHSIRLEEANREKKIENWQAILPPEATDAIHKMLANGLNPGEIAIILGKAIDVCTEIHRAKRIDVKNSTLNENIFFLPAIRKKTVSNNKFNRYSRTSRLTGPQ